MCSCETSLKTPYEKGFVTISKGSIHLCENICNCSHFSSHIFSVTWIKLMLLISSRGANGANIIWTIWNGNMACTLLMDYSGFCEAELRKSVYCYFWLCWTDVFSTMFAHWKAKSYNHKAWHSERTVRGLAGKYCNKLSEQWCVQHSSMTSNGQQMRYDGLILHFSFLFSCVGGNCQRVSLEFPFNEIKSSVVKKNDSNNNHKTNAERGRSGKREVFCLF